MSKDDVGHKAATSILCSGHTTGLWNECERVDTSIHRYTVILEGILNLYVGVYTYV